MTQTGVQPAETSLWHNRNFLLLWTGQSLSLIGDWFFTATTMVWIINKLGRGQSWLPLAVSAIPLAATLPTLIIGPLTGVFVDRWNPQRTMLITDLLRMVLVVFFLFITLTLATPAWLMGSCFLVLFLCATGSQFFNPSRMVMISDLVAAHQRPHAFGMLQQANYFAQIVGPVLAAPLYVSFGPTWAIILDAGTFLVSFLILLAIQLSGPSTRQDERQKEQGYWSAFADGLRFFVNNRVLVHVLLTGMIIMFGGMAYNSFEYLFGSVNLHIPEKLLGLYVACFGVGVLIGMPVSARLVKQVGEARLMPLFMLFSGLTTLVLSRMQSLLPGMLCGVLLGFFVSSIFVTVHPLILRVTPRELVGRIMAFHGPMITVASLLGSLLAGSFASTVLNGFHATFAGMSFGPLDTIFTAIGLLMIGAGCYGMVFLTRAVKDYEMKART